MKVNAFDVPTFCKDVLQVYDERLIRFAQEVGEIRTVKKGECVIKQGDVPTHTFFLIDGIFRGYLSSPEGKEMTDCFAFQPGSTVMPSSDINKPAPVSLEAVTDAHILSFPNSEIYPRIWEYPELQKLYIRLLLSSYNSHWELKTIHYQYDAMERYKWFCKTYPELLSHVKDKDIASFLNMTPITLSRLKQALRERQKVLR